MVVRRLLPPWALLLAALSTQAALAGCAAASPPPPTIAAAAPLPRSSIAAVLAHRGELGLSPEQESRLGAAEAELEVAIEQLMRERQVPTEARPPPTRSTGPTPGQKGAPGTGAPGAPGMSSMPGMAGSYSGGHGSISPTTGMPPPGAAPAGSPPGAPPRAGPSPQAQLDQQLDDLDTAAWLKVEPVLTPPQREQAREIASDYRAARFDARKR